LFKLKGEHGDAAIAAIADCSWYMKRHTNVLFQDDRLLYQTRGYGELLKIGFRSPFFYDLMII